MFHHRPCSVLWRRGFCTGVHQYRSRCLVTLSLPLLVLSAAERYNYYICSTFKISVYGSGYDSGGLDSAGDGCVCVSDTLSKHTEGGHDPITTQTPSGTALLLRATLHAALNLRCYLVAVSAQECHKTASTKLRHGASFGGHSCPFISYNRLFGSIQLS